MGYVVRARPVSGIGAIQAVKTVNALTVMTAMPNLVDPRTVTPCSDAPPLGWGGPGICVAYSVTDSIITAGVYPAPLKFWSEILHTQVRGEPSLLVFLEEFVSVALSTYFTPEGINTAVYDLTRGSGANIDQSLLNRCSTLIQNFQDIFQGNRWQAGPLVPVIGAKLNSDGESVPQIYRYETWVEGTRPDSTKMTNALHRITGQYLEEGGRNEFFAKYWAIVKQVPRYTAPCCDVRFPPAWDVYWSWANQPVLDAKYFWRVQGGELVPTAWSKSLMDLLAPSTGVVSAAKLRVAGKASKAKPVIHAKAIASVKKIPMSTATKVVIAGAAVGGIGVLLWFVL